MTAALNKFEQLRQATGGFKKSDTLSRFKQELARVDSHKKSQLVALKILRTLRMQGLSQKQFAEQVNVTPQQVSKWVKGSENFTFETIEKIEKALETTLIDVVEEKPVLAFSRPVSVAHAYLPSTNSARVDMSTANQKVEKTNPYSRGLQYV